MDNVKHLKVIVLILLLGSGFLMFRLYEQKQKYTNYSQTEIAKEIIRQKKLEYQNEIYELKSEKEVLMKLWLSYRDAFEALEVKDLELHSALKETTDKVRSLSLEELEKHLQNEF